MSRGSPCRTMFLWCEREGYFCLTTLNSMSTRSERAASQRETSRARAHRTHCVRGARVHAPTTSQRTLPDSACSRRQSAATKRDQFGCQAGHFGFHHAEFLGVYHNPVWHPFRHPHGGRGASSQQKSTHDDLSPAGRCRAGFTVASLCFIDRP